MVDMKVLVVGAGALGSVFGCLMRDKGHEVGLVEPSSRLDDVRRLGLRVSGLFGDHHCADFALHPSAQDVPQGYYDLVLVMVKSFHTAEAIRQVGPKAGKNALVISLQNGIGNYEAIRDGVGDERTLAGRVIFGAQIVEPAHVKVTVYAEPVMIGSPTNAVAADRVAATASAFSEAGIPAEATREINKYIWAKMLYNCSLNPLSALLGVPYGRLLDSEGNRDVMIRVVEEIFAVARACAIELFWSEPQEYVDLLFGRLIPDTAEHYASMFQDLEMGGRTEIEALNGAIVRMGEAVGVGCPINSALSQLVRAAEKPLTQQ